MTLRQGTRHIAPRFSPKCIIDVPRKDYQVAKPLEEERSHFSNPFKATLAPDRWTPPQTDERWNPQQAEGEDPAIVWRIVGNSTDKNAQCLTTYLKGVSAFAKDLLAGQEQVCSRITWLFVWLVVFVNVKN